MNMTQRVEPRAVGLAAVGQCVPRTVTPLPDQATMDHWIQRAFKVDMPAMYHVWRFDPEAPGSYAKLKAWAQEHTLGVDPLPVFDGGCDKSIYTKDGNGYFRAWHDYLHLSMDQGFNPEGEEQVAMHHCATLTWVGAPYAVVKAVEADTIGQIRYYQATGRFVDDQRAFVAECLAQGMDVVTRALG